MNKKSIIALSVAVLAAASASAARIELATITANDIPGNGLGTANVESWLAGLVTAYNAGPSADLPAPGSQLAGANVQNGGNSISITTGVYNYVVLHWGGGQGGGKLQAFYIGDIGGAVSNPEVFQSPAGGLSFYRFYNAISNDPTNDPIPDSGASLALLGAGLIGLGAISRRKA